MSQRKLTKQQHRRIQAKLNTLTEPHLSTDLLSGTVIAHHGQHLEVKTLQDNIIPCKKRQNLGAVVVGDKVWWQFTTTKQTEGVVVAIQARQSILHKFSKQGKKTPLAANVDQILILISPAPRPTKTTIDRYLIAAKRDNLVPIIVLNKLDLLQPSLNPEDAALLELLDLYKELGFKVIYIQTKPYIDLSNIIPLLENKSSVIVGQSGVGKSSLIKALLPNLEIITGEIATNIVQGTHTTTTSRLYSLPSGGCIIDSPGVRSFQIDNLATQDLIAGFNELSQFIGLCKYKNCTHKHNEPACAIQQAILENKISRHRFESYLEIADSSLKH